MTVSRCMRAGIAGLMLGLAWPVWAGTDPVFRVSAARIPFYVDNEQQGLFMTWFRGVVAQLPYEFTVDVFPPKRARLVWEMRRADIYFPYLDTSDEQGVLRSQPIFWQQDHAFVRVGTAPVCSWQELASRPMRLGLTEGYVYPAGMDIVLGEDTGREADWVNGDDLNLRKLAAGRIDVFVGEYHSGMAMIRELGLEDSLMASPCPLARRPVSIAVRDSAAGRLLLDRLNQHITRYRIPEVVGAMMEAFVRKPYLAPWSPGWAQAADAEPVHAPF